MSLLETLAPGAMALLDQADCDFFACNERSFFSYSPHTGETPVNMQVVRRFTEADSSTLLAHGGHFTLLNFNYPNERLRRLGAVAQVGEQHAVVDIGLCH